MLKYVDTSTGMCRLNKRAIAASLFVIVDVAAVVSNCTPSNFNVVSLIFLLLLFFFNLRFYVCLFSRAVILVAHFLQSVSSGLVLGGELVYHRGRAEEGGILTLAGQYSSGNSL